MKIVRLVDPDSVGPRHVVMVCLLAATVAGSCLLTSGPSAVMEGAQDWREESPLRAVVYVLNLNYTQTTALGVEIKSLVLGIGAALAAAAFGLSLAVRSPVQDNATVDETASDPPPAETAGTSSIARQIPPLAAAQVLMSAYVSWSFLSTGWSTAPDLALGGSWVLATGVVWALALGLGLNRPTAAAGAYILMVVCAVTGLLAIMYYGERNPTRRAQYPLGNPLFLAACLIPGIVLSVGVFCATLQAMTKRVRTVHWAAMLLCLVAGGLMVWTVRLTGARSGALAAAFGLAALVFFIVRRRAKFLVALAAIVIAFAGLWFYVLPRFSEPSRTGRDASLRVRAYAWAYAVDLIERHKIIGHGQGGFAQFGDAGAEQDVDADPLALQARIAHAHNEWLEVWSDLGAVGFILLIGALGSTLWAGMSALHKLPHAFWRWTLAALMASLVALMVEESADVGLRIAGLPAVFYSVLGLIWAMSRSPGVAAPARLHGRVWARRIGGTKSVVLGAVLFAVSMRDFQAARAYYDVSEAWRSGSFDRAARLAKRATRGRLSPQRRLEAFERLCSTHLFVAREYQTASLDRFQRAERTDPPDANLMRLADSDREQCEAHVAEALEAWKALVRRSPKYWGAGWLELRLWQLRGVYAEVDGDADLASRIASAASDALKRELKRRPYDPIVALSYVDTAGDRLGFDEGLGIIARPLRHGPIPVEYGEFLAMVSSKKGFDTQVPAMTWSGAIPGATRSMPDDPFMPEKLRLAADIHFMRDDYARAVRAARDALLWYDSAAPEGTMGLAACHYELAEYQFFLDPTKWDESLAEARRALALMPDSTPGRQLARAVQARMVNYYLAGGDESSARALLRRQAPGTPDALVSAELGSRYAAFCKSLIRRRREDFPANFEGWVQRATELNPDYELAWRLSAQIAFDKNLLDASVNRLRRALSLGANPRVVYAFVRLALTDHPTDPGFSALESELRAVLQPGTKQAPAGDASDTSNTTVPPWTQ